MSIFSFAHSKPLTSIHRLADLRSFIEVVDWLTCFAVYLVKEIPAGDFVAGNN